MVEITSLSRAFPDSREHGHSTVELGNIINQLHDDHGLANAGAAKGADLAAF